MVIEVKKETEMYKMYPLDKTLEMRTPWIFPNDPNLKLVFK
jgi:hypothetical protein